MKTTHKRDVPRIVDVAEAYAQGLHDGIRSLLLLMLDRDPTSAYEPPPQPLDDDVREWLLDVLARVDEHGPQIVNR